MVVVSETVQLTTTFKYIQTRELNLKLMSAFRIKTVLADKVIFLCFMAFTLTGHSSQAEATSSLPILRYDISASSAWYPYFIPDPERPGIVSELVKIVLKEAGISGQESELPPKRTVLALQNGELDFDITSPSWFPNNQIPAGFVISSGLLEVKEYVVTLPHNAHKYIRQTDLFKQQVGTVRGYNYHNDKMYSRVDLSSEYMLVQALSKGRIEVAILGDLTAKYWAQQTGTEIEFGPINSRGDLHFRLRDEHAQLIPDINLAISKLKAQGDIVAIIARYLPPKDGIQQNTSRSSSRYADK